jgi:branched-chain amino acid transport system substrate-binding protein
MSKTIKIVIGVIVVVVIVILLVTSGKGNDTGPIKIGFIAPLSGNAVTYGEPVKKGIETAVSEINEKGGVDGRQLEVIYEDGKCSNKDATSAAQKLISVDKVKVILGMICSGELLSAAPIAESAKVILIGQGSNPDISNSGDYIFRTFPNDDLVGTALVNQMIKNNVKTVALLSGSSAYTIGLKNNFEAKIKDTSINIVANESYTENTKDYRSMLQKIKVLNPDAIILNTQTGAEGGRAAQQARDLGITAQFYSAFFSGPEFVSLGKIVEGTYIVDTPAVDPNNIDAAAFATKYKEKYGSESSYPFVSANSYDQVYLIADIFEKVGSDDTDKIKEALYNTTAFKGLSGTFGFDKNGDVVGIGMRVMQIQDGKLVLVQ